MKLKNDPRADLILQIMYDEPDTQKELDRRGTKLFGEDFYCEIHESEDHPTDSILIVTIGNLELCISDRPEEECVKAAWYSAVGIAFKGSSSLVGAMAEEGD